MQTRTMTISVIAAFAASPGLWVCAPAVGQTIIPIDQGRHVSTESVNAPQCGPDSLFDDEAAIGFDPFDASVQTQHGCDSGFAGATGSQQSQIDAASMSGTATATSEAHGPIPGMVHAFGISHFVVTFEVASSSRFSLDGIMSAGSFPDATIDAIVLARLWEGPVGGVLLFQQSIEPPPGGGINTVALEGAGVVGILDFLALLAAWGPCPAPPADCPADLDGDGTVGILDLLMLLGNWG